MTTNVLRLIDSRLIVALVAAAGLALIAAPGSAHAAEPGVNVDGVAPGQAMGDASALGAGWVRKFVRWDQLEHAGPGILSGNWVQELDDYVGAAQARGLKVVATVVGAPPWANGSQDPYVPPADPATYARFMGGLASRYRGRVSAWEIWNEPDGSSFWHAPISAPAYAAMLRASYGAIKAADSGAQVYAGPLTGNDYPYLEQLYTAGASGSFDAVSVHTDTACNIASPDVYYRQDGRVGQFSFLGFREVHATMEAHGDGAKPIAMTEIGWSATGTRCGRGASAGRKDAGVTEAQQAAYLKLAYHCLAAYPYVTSALWFSLRDLGTDDRELYRYGLERSNGAHRPAFDALAGIGRYGDRLTSSCGDFDAPSITVLSPSGGSMFDRSLLIRVAARDGTSPLGRISLYGNGRKVRSFTKDLKNGRAVQIDWQGARRLPYGPVTLTVVALDEFGNTTRRDIAVRRVNPATLPPQATTFRLRVSGRGLRRTVRGSLRAPGFAFRPGGKVVLAWQYRRGHSWVTLHKRSANANRAFRYSQRLRKPGRWRVVAQYRGNRPFVAAKATSRAFRAR